MDSTEPMADAHSAASNFFQAPQRLRLVLSLLLALTTIALYSPVMRAPFLNYDDAAHVTDNPQVRAGLTWNTAAWAFRTFATADWHPITWLSHALDCELFGLSPAGPHTVNVLLHVANALLLFLILEGATGLVGRSFMVAALFALHPINVESVAWISERKDVLSMFFFLVALAAYGWYARRPGAARYLAVTVAYALGLMTKAQVITFPLALLLLDYWPLPRLASSEAAGAGAVAARGPSFWKLVWEKVPWLALSAASAVLTMKAEAGATQAKVPFGIHLANAAISYVKYLGKAFWPAHLAVVYPHPGTGTSIPEAVLCGCLMVALTTLAVIYRGRRPFFVGWFWFLGTLVPMIGLVQISVHAMADRYAYIPLLGIFVVVCWGAADLAESVRLPAAVSGAGVVLVLLGLGFALHRQISFWGDNVTLWTHTLEITARNYTAEDNLAAALLAQGRVEEAAPHLRRAILFRPDDAMATLNLATYEQMHGNYQAAIDGYARVPQFTKEPGFVANAGINSGYAHLSLRQYDGAKRDFEAVLTQQPANSAAYRGLGLAAQRGGDIAQAIQSYERAVELQPTAVGYLLLAQALEIGGQGEAARGAQDRAARISPDLNDDLATAKRLLAE